MSSKNERKKGLGRGLSSFLDVDSFGEIGDKKSAEKKITSEPNSPTNLPIEHIIPNQNQPRKDFAKDELSQPCLINKRNRNNTTYSCKKK